MTSACELSASRGRGLVRGRDLIEDPRWDVYDYRDRGECRVGGGGNGDEDQDERYKGKLS